MHRIRLYVVPEQEEASDNFEAVREPRRQIPSRVNLDRLHRERRSRMVYTSVVKNPGSSGKVLESPRIKQLVANLEERIFERKSRPIIKSLGIKCMPLISKDKEVNLNIFNDDLKNLK